MMSSSIALRVVNKFLLEHDEFFYSLCAFVNKFLRMKNTIMYFGSLTQVQWCCSKAHGPLCRSSAKANQCFQVGQAKNSLH